jgi:hypothetical protein
VDFRTGKGKPPIFGTAAPSPSAGAHNAQAKAAAWVIERLSQLADGEWIWNGDLKREFLATGICGERNYDGALADLKRQKIVEEGKPDLRERRVFLRLTEAHQTNTTALPASVDQEKGGGDESQPPADPEKIVRTETTGVPADSGPREEVVMEEQQIPELLEGLTEGFLEISGEDGPEKDEGTSILSAQGVL